MNRHFFALSPSKEIRNNILFQRDRIYISGNLIKDNNLHMTLLFLGKLSINQVSKMVHHASEFSSKPFKVIINRTGYFKQSRAFWFGPEPIPPKLVELHDFLLQSALTCNISVQEKNYKPHITLSRKGSYQEPQSIAPITWPVNGFVLFKSMDTPKGVQYEKVKYFTFNSVSN